MQKTNIPHVIRNIELLISKKVMTICAEKYLVVISESLWNQFVNAKNQTTFLRNLKLYCQLKNAHSGNDIEKQKFQLCVKDASQKVIAIYELHDDKVMKKEL